MFLTGLLPLACSACFLIEHKTTSPGMAPLTMGPPPLITNGEKALQLDLMEAFSQLVMGGGLVGGTISGLIVLGSMKMQAEQARGSKPVRNIPPWPLYQLLHPDLLRFLP